MYTCVHFIILMERVACVCMEGGVGWGGDDITWSYLTWLSSQTDPQHGGQQPGEQQLSGGRADRCLSGTDNANRLLTPCSGFKTIVRPKTCALQHLNRFSEQ